MDACTTDTDCEIHTSCCAYCVENGIVASLNRAYAAYGSLLTLTFYCPMCAEGGCNISPPRRTPICKAGRCARRDVWTDPSGKVTTHIVDNDPAQLVLTPDREAMLNIMHHACTRAVVCGLPDIEASDCDQVKVPENFSCDAATRCYAAIDTMTCPPATATLDIFAALTEIRKLPACARLERMCITP